MDFLNDTARGIIKRLKVDPLDLPAWHDLSMLAFEQKESEAFRSYQVIVDGLEQLVERRPEGTIFGSKFAAPTLEDDHISLLLDCALEPLEARHIGTLAHILLEDAKLPLAARRLAARAAVLEPSTRQWDRLVDRCKQEDKLDIGASEAAFDPAEANSAVIRPTKPRKISELKDLMMTSIRVTPELLGEQEASVNTTKTSRCRSWRLFRRI